VTTNLNLCFILFNAQFYAGHLVNHALIFFRLPFVQVFLAQRPPFSIGNVAASTSLKGSAFCFFTMFMLKACSSSPRPIRNQQTMLFWLLFRSFSLQRCWIRLHKIFFRYRRPSTNPPPFECILYALSCLVFLRFFQPPMTVLQSFPFSSLPSPPCTSSR